ncbi:ABC transporter permease [Roseibacillus persicicus]|uniref:ABC transporter permease n=1 Tax=Roseibacillus persicicus TaxID=454148 RepID=UPI00398B21C6
MSRVPALSLAYFRQHPLRVVLTSIATAAAAAMVVWVVSGYDALLGTFDRYANLALGRYPLSVAPISNFSQYAPGAIPSPAEKFVPAEAIAKLREDPAVAAADPFWVSQQYARPFVKEGETPIPPYLLPAARLVGTDAPEPPFDLVAGKWLSSHKSPSPTGVLSELAASGMKIEVGDHVLVGPPGRVTKVEVIGIVGGVSIEGWNAQVASSQLLVPSIGGLYVSTSLAEEILERPSQISFVAVALNDDTDLTQFRYHWATRLSKLGTPCQFQEAHDVEEALDESASAENLALQARAATIVSTLAALFIIFSTLNMGVNERVRQLAILRATALTRGQVGQLIAIEGLLFGTIGFVVGCGAGAVIIAWASRSAPDLLTNGAVVGPNSLMLAALCSYGGALLASLVPAIRAMRVRPIDAMSPPPSAPRHCYSVRGILGGLALLSVYPLLALGIKHNDGAPFVSFMFSGLFALSCGFILLAPSIVMTVDRLASPLLARLMRIPPMLLASQISGNLGRTVATALALTVGLGLFVAIQTWGHSMLGGFMPGSWAPDALIGFKPGGIERPVAEQVAKLEGVTKGLPIIVEQPRLFEDLTNSAVRATVVRQDNVVIVGVDSEPAFGGDDPLFTFRWVEGNAREAVTKLKNGRACLVPDHFLTETGLQIGDSFQLVPPNNPSQPVSYEIAGVVKLPGWHWQTKPTGFRTRTHRSAALVFADYAAVENDFDFHSSSHVWFNYDPTLTTPEKLAESAQALYSGALGKEVGIGGALNDEPYVQINTIDDIRALVNGHATQWLWILSRLPLIVLIITSIGVLNALLASVQSRRWEFGVLRATGITHRTIVRLIIAEGLLLGAVACSLSLGFGVLAGWCGAGISQYISFFGGMPPEFVVPWKEIAKGFALVLFLSTLASLWPALTIGRKKPLELLQEGRGSF